MKHVGARKDLVNGLVASLLGNAQRRANIRWTWQLMVCLHTKYEPDLTTFSISNSSEYFSGNLRILSPSPFLTVSIYLNYPMQNHFLEKFFSVKLNG